MPSIYIKAKKRTEKPLEAKNEPKASQEPSQELKTQELDNAKLFYIDYLAE